MRKDNSAHGLFVLYAERKIVSMAERCKKCGKLVEYQLIGEVYPGGKDREEAICPYCGTVLESRMTSQYYFVRGLEDGNNSDTKK